MDVYEDQYTYCNRANPFFMRWRRKEIRRCGMRRRLSINEKIWCRRTNFTGTERFLIRRTGLSTVYFHTFVTIHPIAIVIPVIVVSMNELIIEKLEYVETW
jgi:hypothetical protein